MPGSLHESHCESHADEQQNPSAHCPEVHSLFAVHVRPLGLPAVQTPESQYGVDGVAFAHWRSSVHAPRQSLPEQPCGHVIVSSGRHAPAPSHPATFVFVPPVQLCARHCVVGCGKVHAVRTVPVHAPAHSAVPAHAARGPCGVPITGAHTPSSDATSHASHCPSHSELQQRASTQKPVAHSSPFTHVSALLFFGGKRSCGTL